MKTLILEYDTDRQGFGIQETAIFIPALQEEVDDVIDWLARKLCDNPSAQAAVGILGDDSFDIQVAF